MQQSFLIIIHYHCEKPTNFTQTTDDNERFVGESSPGHLEDQKGENAGRSSSSGSCGSDSGSSSSGKCSLTLNILYQENLLNSVFFFIKVWFGSIWRT